MTHTAVKISEFYKTMKIGKPIENKEKKSQLNQIDFIKGEI